MAALSINIHASCVRLGGAGAAFGAPADCGILLLGSSGSGKSDLALRLMAAGAELVADDRTDLFVRHGRLYAKSPTPIAGLMEVRGIGILAMPHGGSAKVTLVARLRRSGARLPVHRLYRPPAALRLPAKAAPPVISIAPFEASAPAKLAAAAAAYALGLHREVVNPI
jgi:HPr kinase/phosphorylase